MSITCSAERQDMTKETQGKRIADGEWPEHAGEYSKFVEKSDKISWIMIPPGMNRPGRLSVHTVVEHEDGTITVSPSILFTEDSQGPGWHGYLEKGIWREC